MKRGKLRDDICVQMYCAMLIRGKRNSYGAGPWHVDEVLLRKSYFKHTSKSIREAVDDYIDGGCGIHG